MAERQKTIAYLRLVAVNELELTVLLEHDLEFSFRLLHSKKVSEQVCRPPLWLWQWSEGRVLVDHGISPLLIYISC